MPPIEIRNVSVVYDTPAGDVPGVAGVSFNIEGLGIPVYRRPVGLW